jgi:hypothetical protein
VPTTVCKKVKTCVCEEVPVKHLRLVRVEKPVCEQACKPECKPTNECCEEGFLHRLFGHRYCCDNPCDNACGNGGPVYNGGKAAEPLPPPQQPAKPMPAK